MWHGIGGVKLFWTGFAGQVILFTLEESGDKSFAILRSSYFKNTTETTKKKSRQKFAWISAISSVANYTKVASKKIIQRAVMTKDMADAKNLWPIGVDL